jgi:ribulose-phosphate 3-epimerase
MIIAPSLLSMDFTQTLSQLNEIKQSHATWLHFDVMDGHFVPNLSFGPDICKQIRQNSDLFMDVHIMVSDPNYFSDVFMDVGANLITFHLEACANTEEVIQIIDKIHAKNVKVGLSIKPATNLESLFPYLDKIDLVLIMSVNPGYGGQSFMMSALDKIRALKEIIVRENYQVLIEVDGGINDDTAKLVLDAGADVLVAGSYIFKQNISETIEKLWNLK